MQSKHAKTKHRHLLFLTGFIFIAGAIALFHGLLSGQIARRQLNNGIEKKLGDSGQIKKRLAGGNCSGSGHRQLSHSAMDANDFNVIIPHGLMTGGHITPALTNLFRAK